MGDIEVIPPRLGFETGCAIRGDAIAEPAFHPLELAAAGDLLGKLLIAPHAIDQNTHLCTSAGLVPDKRISHRLTQCQQ